MAFIGSFLQYLITLVILAAIGMAGIFVGKTLRVRKDAKVAEASDNTND